MMNKFVLINVFCFLLVIVNTSFAHTDLLQVEEKLEKTFGEFNSFSQFNFKKLLSEIKVDYEYFLEDYFTPNSEETYALINLDYFRAINNILNNTESPTKLDPAFKKNIPDLLINLFFFSYFYTTKIDYPYESSPQYLSIRPLTPSKLNFFLKTISNELSSDNNLFGKNAKEIFYPLLESPEILEKFLSLDITRKQLIISKLNFKFNIRKLLIDTNLNVGEDFENIYNSTAHIKQHYLTSCGFTCINQKILSHSPTFEVLQTILTENYASIIQSLEESDSEILNEYFLGYKETKKEYVLRELNSVGEEYEKALTNYKEDHDFLKFLNSWATLEERLGAISDPESPFYLSTMMFSNNWPLSAAALFPYVILSPSYIFGANPSITDRIENGKSLFSQNSIIDTFFQTFTPQKEEESDLLSPDVMWNKTFLSGVAQFTTDYHAVTIKTYVNQNGKKFFLILDSKYAYHEIIPLSEILEYIKSHGVNAIYFK